MNWDALQTICLYVIYVMIVMGTAFMFTMLWTAL
jgi:hypothetical protein